MTPKSTQERRSYGTLGTSCMMKQNGTGGGNSPGAAERLEADPGR